MNRISHYIDGKQVTGGSGRRGDVFNPALGQKSHEVDLASVDEVDEAVAAATAAAPAWRNMSLSRRSDILFGIRETLDAHRADIARCITEQHGKVLSDAMGEVAGHRERRLRLWNPGAPRRALLRAGLDRD